MSQVCKRCGEWEDECTCGNKPKPKPTYEELTAENERLLRVVEQADLRRSHMIICGAIYLSGDKGRVGDNGTHPDLYAHLKRETDDPN
jgi:hypothetical protein